ncbi:MAG TPA: aldehyde dehydrogenase family protein [Thermoleophilaceae bacterium]|jgi:1-pyrroline-5-carboxylate dehydrogenase|nr:aldehyde dehydrogenase family protein [Thermoleophilaceae bacterium]
MSTRLTYTSGDLGAETDAAFEAALESARAGEAEPHAHLIAGEQVADGEPFERRDPARSDRVASRAHGAGPELVERAVAAARAAAPGWAATPYEERCGLLREVANGIGERHMELAGLASLETGKSRTESILEVQEAIDLIEAYAGHMEENDGYTRPLGSFVEGERNLDVLRPYGVFGVIAPFNFPVALSVGMFGSALIAGNAVVFKPSEESPSTGAVVAEIVHAAGLPPGAFNLVHGGPDSGRALVNAAVDGVAFTGSAEVGREIARKLQEGRYARPALTEMGGKNPAIVAASADLEAAAEGVARSAFGLSGQKCSACSRAIVVDSAHDEFVELLAARAAELPLGDPADRDAFVGPVINERSVERFERAVAAAEREGRVAAGGGTPDLPGHFVEPTVVAGLPLGHALERDELFLPFVTVTRVGSFDEAMAEANAPVYGLTAGVFTGDDAEKERFLAEIEAGVVYVNRRAGATTGAWPGTQTFCGWKSSGSTGKGGLGAWYLPQFMREQSRTIVG